MTAAKVRMAMNRSKLLIGCGILMGVLQLAGAVDGCLAQSGSRRSGGNQELMNDWVKQKQKLKNRIIEELRSRQQLPERGHVEFEAKVKRNPAKPDDYIVEIEKFRVYDTYNTTTEHTIAGSNTSQLNHISEPPAAVPTYVRGTIDFSGRAGYPEKFTFQEVLQGGAANLDPRSFDDLPIGQSAAASKVGGGPRGNDRVAAGGHQGEDLKGGSDALKKEAKESKSWWRRLLGL